MLNQLWPKLSLQFARLSNPHAQFPVFRAPGCPAQVKPLTEGKAGFLTKAQLGNRDRSCGEADFLPEHPWA